MSMDQPKLRFKSANSKPFPSWEIAPLATMASIYDGTHQTPTYVKDGIPFYSVEHVTANNFSDTKYISREVYNAEIKRVKIERGDILMTRIGDIGTARLVDWDVEASFYVSLALLKIKDDVRPEFLSQYIQTRRFQAELWKRTIHVAFPKKINLGEIGSCQVMLPVDDEQQKIASFLSAVDEKIRQLKLKKELLEQYKKGVMQQLFSGKLRFKNENGKSYPKWEERPFGAVCRFINGKAYKQEELLKEGKYRVLRVGNLFSNNEWYYSDLELEEDKYIENGDLIYAWSATFGPRFWQEEKVIYHYHIWKVIPNDEADRDYLFHAFLFDVEGIKAVSQGGTMFHITKGNIETRKFKFPHKEEQQKIASFLTSLDAKIEAVSREITQTQTFKKGLLQQMFV